VGVRVPPFAPSLATLVLVAQGGPRASRPAARPAPRPSSGESTPPPITRCAGAIASLGGLKGLGLLGQRRVPRLGLRAASPLSFRFAKRHRFARRAQGASGFAASRAPSLRSAQGGSHFSAFAAPRLALRAASPLSHQSLPGIQHPARRSVLVGHADLRRRPRKVSGRIRHATGETSAGTAARSTRCVRPRNGLPSRLLIYTKRRRAANSPGRVRHVLVTRGAVTVSPRQR
jgi:hypothetical protein